MHEERRESNGFKHLDPADLGKLKVKQHKGRIAGRALRMWPSGKEIIQGFRTIACDDHLMCELAALQCNQGQFQIMRIVFGQQNR